MTTLPIDHRDERPGEAESDRQAGSAAEEVGSTSDQPLTSSAQAPEPDRDEGGPASDSATPASVADAEGPAATGPSAPEPEHTEEAERCFACGQLMPT